MGVCVSKRVVEVASDTALNRAENEEAGPSVDAILGRKCSTESRVSGCCEEPRSIMPTFTPEEKQVSDLREQTTLYDDTTVEERKCREVIRKLLPDSSSGILEVVHELEGELVSEINTFIFTIPEKFLMSAKDLAERLTGTGARYLELVANNDQKICIAKYYAIYAWIANHIYVDIPMWKAEMNGNCKNDITDIQLVLQHHSGTAYAFALLFSAICKEAGLAAEIVKGSIRRWQCVAGELFKPNPSNAHFWNIVKLQNNHFVVDTMLGSGYITYSLNFVKDFNSHHFAIPSNYSILVYWPEDLSQQYLETPLSLKDIQPLVPVDATAIHLGVVPVSWCENVEVTTSDPVTIVVVKLKPNCMYVRPILMPIFDEYDESIFRSLVYVEKLAQNLLKIYAVLPTVGKYVLNIYVPNSPFQNKIFLSYILTYKGNQCCDELGYPFIFPMPADSFNFKLLKWSSEDCKPHVCKHIKPTAHCTDFEADPDLSFHHCITEGKQVELDEIEQSKVLFYNSMLVRKGNGKYQLLTVFPRSGWWTIHLSAGKELDEDGTTSGYTKLLTYSLYIVNGKLEHTYPQVFKTRSVFFNSDPITPPVNEPMKISFESSAREWVCSVSNNDSTLQGHAVVNLTQSHTNGTDLFQLIAIFPVPGTWYVLAYSQLVGQDSYTAMFKLQVQVTQALPNKCLIRTYAKPKKTFKTTFPNSGILSFHDNGKPFHFSFTAPSSGIEFLPVLKNETNELVEFVTFLSSKVLNSELSEINISLLFPKSGCWTTEIFARSKSSANTNFSLLATLSLPVEVPTPEVCYPKILPFFHEAGMILNEANAPIQSKCTTGKLTLPFQAPDSANFFCTMENVQCLDHSQLAYIQHAKDSRQFHLYAVFPELGAWTVSLYGRIASPGSSGTEDFSLVLQFPIINTAAEACVAYPQIYDGFHKFKLYFSNEDIPLPAVVSIESGLQHLLVKFYSPKGISFLHYATVSDFGQSEETDPPKRVMTTMVSDRATRSHTIQVDVDCPGQWNMYLFAETTKNEDIEWMPILKYKFTANL